MEAEKFNLKLAFCISLFSFASYVTQPLYSAFVPLLLSRKLEGAAEVGVILSFCNLLAMLIHPVVGEISDRTRCRFGRRRPYILSGAVLSGISFMLIPWLQTIGQFSAVLLFYSLALAYWKAPVAAIQIDCVKPEHLTQSNAVASCVLALSSVISYLAGNGLTTSGLDERWVFLFGGASAIITGGIGCLTVHERDSRKMVLSNRQKKRKVAEAFLVLDSGERKKMIVMIFCILFAFMASYGFEYFFVLFLDEKMHGASGQATLYLAAYMTSYLAVSIYFISTRKNFYPIRMTVISMGTAAGLLSGVFILCRIETGSLPEIMWIVCILYGVCWGTFNIYIYPLWLTLKKGGHSGNLMGVYFVCTGLAMTIVPTLYGVIHDLSRTYDTVFAFCGVMFLFAFGMLKLNERGEKNGDTKSKNFDGAV